MTHEEAKRIAIGLRTDFKCESDTMVDFCNTVIKALEQEPCEDAISRQVVMDALCNGCELYKNREQTCFSKCEEYHFLATLPPVTPKSETVTEFADRCRECGKMRKGHWIYDNIVNNWRCDKCGETPKTMGYVGTADFMSEHFRFCNHCGARMFEPQESEE